MLSILKPILGDNILLMYCNPCNINTTIKITSVCDGDAWSVGGGRGWLAGDPDGLAGDG